MADIQATEEELPITRVFEYRFKSKGHSYDLRVPLTLPYCRDPREQASRLVSAHKLPCHLEDDLCEQLKRFAGTATMELLDQKAEDNFYGGSVFEKGSETDQTIQKWSECFTENNVQFSSPVDIRHAGSELAFSEVYHKLIHSPALETLLQLEHTYALAVREVCKGRDNAREIMQKRHDADLSLAMKELGISKSERDINSLMRQHTLERESCEMRWSSELSQLQETQRREYREWVTTVYEDMSTPSDNGKKSPGHAQIRGTGESPFSSNDDVYPPDNVAPPLEESFTINLGAQKKSMHNIRVICGDPLDLCRHRNDGIPNPERLQTSMSLYSSKLSALILMVDGRVNALMGTKEAFASVCHQSTDFHFPDIDIQLSQVQECAVMANRERQAKELSRSESSSSTSDSQQVSRSQSPLVTEHKERGNISQSDSNSSHNQQLHPPHNSVSYTVQHADDLENGSMAAGTGQWSNGGLSDNVHRGLTVASSNERKASPLLETTSVSLEPGDFYITRHSNLSQVHIVFHLVTDDAAVQSTSLKARHPIMIGLKNCLRTITRRDVHHITIPLLLTYSMQPEMTITWCLKRAEMVFKCVKGFMLENTSWGESDSRTMQFLIPPGMSEEVFEEICEMLPKIFRVTSSRNFTSRTRTFSSNK